MLIAMQLVYLVVNCGFKLFITREVWVYLTLHLPSATPSRLYLMCTSNVWQFPCQCNVWTILIIFTIKTKIHLKLNPFFNLQCWQYALVRTETIWFMSNSNQVKKFIKIFNNKTRFVAESVRSCLFWRHCLYTVRHSDLYCIHVSTCNSDESIAV